MLLKGTEHPADVSVDRVERLLLEQQAVLAARSVALAGDGAAERVPGQIAGLSWLGDPRISVALRALERAVGGPQVSTEVERDLAAQFVSIVMQSSPRLDCMRLPSSGTLLEKMRTTRREFLSLIDADRWIERAAFAPAMQAYLGGVGALSECKPDVAAEAFSVAHRGWLLAGQNSKALDAGLRAWEAEYAPGGQAHLLNLKPRAGADAERFAVEYEQARGRVGPMYSRGVAALSALEKLEKSHRASLEQQARQSYFRSVVELRLVADGDATARSASRAIVLANAAHRPELADAARVVRLLLAFERGEAAATPMLTELMQSFEQRGRPGALRMLVSQIVTFARELLSRGLDGRAFDMLAQLRTAHDRFGLQTAELTNVVHIADAELYSEYSCHEDGIAALTRASAAVRNTADAAPEKAVYVAVDELAVKAAETALGRSRSFDAWLDQADLGPSGEAFKALIDGDRDPMVALLAGEPSPNLLGAIPQLCSAAPDKILASIDAIDARALSLDARIVSGRPPALDQIVVWTLDRISERVTECATRLKRKDLFDAAIRLRSRIGIARKDDCLVERLLLAQRFAEAAAETVARAEESALERRGVCRLGALQGLGASYETAALYHLSAGASHVEEAVRLLEIGRQQSLLDANLSRGAILSPDLARLAVIERSLAQETRRIRLLEKASASSRHTFSAERRAIHARLTNLRDERERLAQRLGTHEKRLSGIGAAAPTLALLREAMSPEESLVYFLVSTTQAYAIVVDRSDVSLVSLRTHDAEGIDELGPKLLAYERAVREGTGSGDLRIGMSSRFQARRDELRKDIYDLLIRPIEKHVAPRARVIIVPDARTAWIPFSELGPKDRPWIARNTLRVVPSARMLLDIPPVAHAQPRALVCGDPSDASIAQTEAGRAWGPLPGARREAERVARLLHTDPLLGRDVTEERLKSELPGASLIHLGLHGTSDAKQPAYSAIVLAHPDKTSTEDGILHAYEIEKLPLVAELVVLSACETGKGNVRGTEGVFAVDRAFLTAGARAVISSLWLVDDEATETLMTNLYDGVMRGAPADVALADAVNRVRAVPKWSAPKYWAAFRLVGGGSRKMQEPGILSPVSATQEGSSEGNSR